MTLIQNPSIVTDNLLLLLDFANYKTYNYAENLLPYSERFDLNTSSNFIATANVVYAPDNTLTGNLLTLNNSGSNFTNRSLDTGSANNYARPSIYTYSFYIKPATQNIISLLIGTNYYDTNTSGGLYFRVKFQANNKIFYEPQLDANNFITNININDFTYGYKDDSNGWIRVYTTANLSNANSSNTYSVTSGLYIGEYGNTIAANGTSVYIWGNQLERNDSAGKYVKTEANNVTKSNSVNCIFGPTFTTSNSEFIFNTDKTIRFSRVATGNPKIGGGIYCTPTENLTVQNFIYNNHTWEIWFRINDISYGNYDITEGNSILSVYQGYHQGFMYTNSNLYYMVWDYDGITAISYNACTWTLGTTNQQIIQGNWYQLAVTNNNKVFTPYLNGEPLGTGSTLTDLRWNNLYTDGRLYLGKSNITYPGGSYSYFGKNNVSNMKMYNKVLSPLEIKSNFNSLRGRFGI